MSGAMPYAPSARDLELVLAHLRTRTRSHPESPATGLYWIPPVHWRTCIVALRAEGHRITEVFCASGDRACNEIGYVLDERTLSGVARGQEKPK